MMMVFSYRVRELVGVSRGECSLVGGLGPAVQMIVTVTYYTVVA